MAFVKGGLTFLWKAGVVIFVLCAAVLVPHDIVVFSVIRERIDRTIEGADLDTAIREPAIRRSFGLDAQPFYLLVAFELYRREHAERWDPEVSFHSEKIPATLVWGLELWLWYDRASLEVFYLRRWRVDTIAEAVFTKKVPALSAYELDCVARFVRARWHQVCPELETLRDKPEAWRAL
jgi:hypothetical protein